MSSLDDAKLLAGGQSLMPMLNFRYVAPRSIVDLNRIQELQFCRREGDSIVVGAMTRQRDLEASSLIREQLPRHTTQNERVRGHCVVMGIGMASLLSGGCMVCGAGGL